MYVSAVTSLGRKVLHCRLGRLEHSVNPLFISRASTSSTTPFPFPSHTNPTPHEIFHLPQSASQDEVKTRYYELVKVYHPDAALGKSDVSSSDRNSRFRAITRAYDILRGRTGLNSKRRTGVWDYRDESMRAELRRRSCGSRSSSTETATNSEPCDSAEDPHLWYTLATLAFVGIIVAMGSISSHMDRVERHTQSAATNLSQARAEAQLYGMERRRMIRERVRSYYDVKETGNKHPEPHTSSKTWQDEASCREMGIESVLEEKQT